MEIDLTDNLLEDAPIEITKNVPNPEVGQTTVTYRPTDKKLISCLRNEKVAIKFIPREGGLVTDPKHILYGGLGVNSKRRFVVPLLQSGAYVNVLTNAEKDYLEYIMGLPENAMSVYRKQDNFWANKGVTLGKDKAFLDLSDPDDYIKYKILLANKDYIAPSEEVLKSAKKATYQYVITREGDEIQSSLESLNTTSKAYLLFGELKEDLRKLSLLIELATGRTIASHDKKVIYAQTEKLIREKPEKFVEVAEDVYLDTKLLIKDGIETGHIRKRGQYYYLTEGNIPLCNEKQEPTLQSACEYLNAPKYQEVKFALEAKIKG